MGETLQYEDGGEYTGHIDDNNKRHGKGQMVYADGSSYNGNFVNDLRDGNGSFEDAKGQKYYGGWSEDKRVGVHTLTKSNGHVVSVVEINGEDVEL